VLSAPYLEIKRLRSKGQIAAALSKLRGAPPASDEDAFEAAVCLLVCGDVASAVNVCRTRNWKTAWTRHASGALVIFLRDGDPARALAPARLAVAERAAGYDAKALLLLLLQASGRTGEADDYIQRHLAHPPPDETLLRGVMAEIAAAVADWAQAYRLASSVVACAPEDFRALITLSVVNHAIGNFHEALGNALRARLAQPQAPQATLQIMRCHNALSDYYAALGAFDALEDKAQLAPDLPIERATAYAGLALKAEAVAAFHAALRGGTPPLAALRALITLHADAHESAEIERLLKQYPAEIAADIHSQLALGLERLQHGDVAGAAQRLEDAFALARSDKLALNDLPWPVPEPRLRHDCEQLELLARRGKLDAAGRQALAVLKRYYDPAADVSRTFAPAGKDAALLQQALTGLHYRPDTRFDGHALADNDYAGIETRYFAGTPPVVVIDNFLSPDALAALRRYCEEATVWRMNNTRGYVGALLAQGFNPGVLLAIAHELKQAMPRVIGDLPLLQAWAFKYDQRMQGINMHADFAKVNVNFWITPDAACADHTNGGMIVYDLPAPASWTFADYNTHQSKMRAYLKVNNAQFTRVPYRENRCVLFDSSLIHITDELHFKPGYENRRVNVTLLYGRARTLG
jgi:hypothetical protein